MPKRCSTPMADPAAPASKAGGLGAAEGAGYLALGLGDEVFALPVAALREVIRRPDLTPVPRASGSLAGLASLRGEVLPVLDLRRLLRRPCRQATEATRVVVCAGEPAFGLLVDTVGRLFGDHSALQRLEGEDTDAARLLDGILPSEAADRAQAIPVLAASRLLRGGASAAPQPPRQPVAGPAMPAPGNQGAAPRITFVSLFVAEREFALPLHAIDEIAPAPPKIAAMDARQGEVLGVVARQGRLLPIVSLRALLGLPPVADGVPERLVVVRLDGAAAFGLVADRQGEVLSPSAEQVDAVPALLARRARLDLAGICRLEGGARLVGVLAPERLAGLEGVRRAAALSEAEEEKAPMQGEADPAAGGSTALVVFLVGGQHLALPVAAVEEVLRLPEALTPVPRAPGFVEGVLGLRGEVLPVIDLRRRLGLDAPPRSGRERILVPRLGGVRAGFLVDAVIGVQRVPEACLSPAPDLARDRAEVVGQVAHLDGRLVLVLDADRLLDRDEAGALVDSLAEAG